MNIPTNWTFKDKHIAEGFDAHVREQLPWYDLATKSVVHFGRHYIPPGGKIYDIGASTGNISMALLPVARSRDAKIIAVEESDEMVEIMANRIAGISQIKIEKCDAMSYKFEQYDFAICFLVFMFLPVNQRGQWLARIKCLIRPGGALVIVDKITTPKGYAGTALRRLAMEWKMASGTPHEDICKKELSLAGYQRPVDESIMSDGIKFFQMGEFAGWIFEREEQ
jgi:tRNA (cmo5U34)-methyltransferase